MAAADEDMYSGGGVQHVSFLLLLLFSAQWCLARTGTAAFVIQIESRPPPTLLEASCIKVKG